MTSMIEMQHLVREFVQPGREKTKALGLDDVSLDVATGEFFVLLGPSGSGKTTCLRMLAGLDEPTSGRISIDGTPVYDSAQRIWVGPETRPQAMVFQSYALWPQFSVRKNIEFPLVHGARKVGKKLAQRRSEEVIDLLDLGPVAQRKVTQLSGGQQQRVALARALALEPKVLLMDEPLSNLDVELRSRVRDEIKRLTVRAGVTTVLVTHDQEEAFAVGDKMAILNRGRIEQIGGPEAVYRSPQSRFVANFLDRMNEFEGVVESREGDAAAIHLDGDLRVTVPTHRVRVESDLSVGRRVSVGIRPTGFSVSSTPSGNAFPARVERKVFLGASHSYEVSTPAGSINVRLDLDSAYEVGTRLFLLPNADATAVFPAP